VIFGPTALHEALGAILAHTTRLPGRVIPKGTVLDEAAIAALHDAGIAEIEAARLEQGDVGEDEAAGRLADALAGPGIVRLRAGTGRANLAAGQKGGLFRADSLLVRRLNGLHEGITIATLPDATPVRAGELLATVKIIPFAIPRAALAEAESVVRCAPPLRLPPFRPLRAGLVLTTLSGLKESVLDGTIETTAQRIAGLGGQMLPTLRVAHQAEAIATALIQLLGQGAQLLLIAGASAVVDRADVGPAGIIRAGGSIDHFGMPVDPGNLICLGHVGAVPAIVLPGCARSPKLNGIDLVLRLIFAGEPAGGLEVANMGVGGLLKEFAPRPAPRAGRKPALPAQPRIAAVVLAAGLSRRMAPRNKLLLSAGQGGAMVAQVAANCCEAGIADVLVVLGHQAEAVEEAVRTGVQAGTVRFIRAGNYADGLSASLRAGISALPEDVAAALVCLGDMPMVSPEIIANLAASYDPDEGRVIVVPTCRGKLGNPVLWDRRFFGEILALSGDTGARGLLRKYADQLHEVEAGEGILLDFDTPESLIAAEGQSQQALPPGPRLGP
jgi:molybdenum cofactor cytidylyltransferase